MENGVNDTNFRSLVGNENYQLSIINYPLSSLSSSVNLISAKTA
jgi:hypothetical protein